MDMDVHTSRDVVLVLRWLLPFVRRWTLPRIGCGGNRFPASAEFWRLCRKLARFDDSVDRYYPLMNWSTMETAVATVSIVAAVQADFDDSADDVDDFENLQMLCDERNDSRQFLYL
ncbi:unnamed protein product [Anisakis simplex]|uniref:Uncharacterized protein n=1 Tax=Anisakis simplex TaxID=6269 RepID=A0A0M3KID4_ANISI|nr:unnamed protein product [Anisakis simplex]